MMPHHEPATLFYDEDCGFCVWTANFLKRWTFGNLRAASLDSQEAEEVLGGVEPELRFNQAWVRRNGELYGGHEAMWQSFYMLPLGFLLRPLRVLPGFQPLSRRIYRWIADRRSPACRLRSSR